MRNIFMVAILFCLLSACNQEAGSEGGKTTTIISNDTVSTIRKSIRRKPVAAYMIPIGNPKLDYKFGVQVYETRETFKFLLRMQYEGMVVTDTLKVPNFGTMPEVAVRPGTEKLSCIIGFLDKEKHFKEYKQLTVNDNQLKLTVLKRYGVSTYSTRAEETPD